jgi:H+-transporting ATPase
MMFLRFILGGHLLLFVTRTRRPFLRPPYPSWQLLSAIVATQIVGVLFVGLGWLMPAISWAAIGLIWAYDIAWMVAMELVKLATYRLIEHRARHHRLFLGLLHAPLHSAYRGHRAVSS